MIFQMILQEDVRKGIVNIRKTLFQVINPTATLKKNTLEEVTSKLDHKENKETDKNRAKNIVPEFRGKAQR